MGLDSKQVVTEVLGYAGDGDFPFCKTLEDLTKVYDFLKKKEESLKSKHSPVEESDFMKIAKEIGGLLEYKNKQYGNSALNPLNVFSGKSKVGQRADDKRSRIQNSESLRENDLVDLAGYIILMLVENGWGLNLGKFKD